jgi:hypothetical protein
LEVLEALGIQDVEPSQHTEIFVLELVPYASVYLSNDAMMGGECASRIAGLWATLGFTVPAAPDHLASMLALLAALEDEGAKQEPGSRRSEAISRAKAVLFWEYLEPWAPLYALKVKDVAGESGYGQWADLLLQTLMTLAGRYSDLKPRSLTHVEEGLLFDDAGIDGFRVFVVPSISGVILSRNDLLRCGFELGIGARAGERWFILRTMLEIDHRSVLEWIYRYLTSERARYCRFATETSTNLLAGSLVHLDRMLRSLEVLKEDWAVADLLSEGETAGSGGPLA